MEKSPSPEELVEARERGREDAERDAREAETRSVADDPPGDTGPYAFAPEALQAEYERGYDERRRELESER